MTKHASDTVFDGLTVKFANNIYGTSKGELRHQILLYALADTLALPTLNVLELGGGTGLMSKAFAQCGHNVMYTDASAEILAHAKHELHGIDNVQFTHTNLQDVSDMANYQVIICHAVLEWLHDPFTALTSIFKKMATGSTLSLSFYNRDAALFSNAVYGNLDYIAQGMKVKKQVKLNPKNPLRPQQVIDFTESCGMTIQQVTGIRCFHDYMKHKPANSAEMQKLVELEKAYCQQAPYKWLGKYMHLLITK